MPVRSCPCCLYIRQGRSLPGIASGTQPCQRVAPVRGCRPQAVAAFAIAIPYGKALCLAAIHYGQLGPRALPLIEIIGKLSVADVFLIALYIVLIKGVGIGHVTSAWGLWLFTGCVLTSIWVGFQTKREFYR